MYIISDIQNIKDYFAQGCCLTIGNFDGVHLGHKKLLEKTCRHATAKKIPSTVLTFWPHPLQVLAGSHAPPLITTREQRLGLLKSFGIDICLDLTFNREFAAQSPEEFIKNILVPIKTSELIIGYDFSIGKLRQGTAEILAQLGEKYGFSVEQIPPVIINGAIVSSTRIRNLIRTGNVWEAYKLLDHFFTIQGMVTKGHGRGHGLGFPTANIYAEDILLPHLGVYASLVQVKEQIFPAVTNVGYNPTFNNDSISIESFLLDADVNLYGENIEVSFVQFLRDEKRFSDIDALKKQIALDIQLTKQILDNASFN